MAYTAEDGDEAVALMQQHGDTLDMVFMDIQVLQPPPAHPPTHQHRTTTHRTTSTAPPRTAPTRTAPTRTNP